jgi:hypothetical protein
VALERRQFGAEEKKKILLSYSLNEESHMGATRCIFETYCLGRANFFQVLAIKIKVHTRTEPVYGI